MKRDDTVYLRHILDAIVKIEEYMEGINEDEKLFGEPFSRLSVVSADSLSRARIVPGLWSVNGLKVRGGMVYPDNN